MEKFISTEFKSLCSLAAIALTFIAFIPYILSILKNRTRPHAFSWIIWGITTIIVFFAQYTEKGGLGSYPIGVSGLITIFIAVLSYIKRTDSTIKKIDYVFLLISLSSLPFWYITSDPLLAVVILTSADLAGFAPTFRKAYEFPYQEDPLFFAIFIFRNFLSILALENLTVTTVLFPLAVGLGSLLLTLLILLRRVELKKTKLPSAKSRRVYFRLKPTKVTPLS